MSNLKPVQASSGKVLADLTIPVQVKISEKGCLSVYIPGRQYPVSLYRTEWMAILSNAEKLLKFVRDHEAELPTKSTQPANVAGRVAL